MIDPIEQAKSYIEQVHTGSILTCKPVQMAVNRHLNDLETGHERGLYFDEDAAYIALSFFPLLSHSKGKWAGKPFILSDWQAFFVYCLFGWKRSDGTRRFRIAYAEIARKNGKSTFAAAIGLYMLIADGEAGAEVYTAATTRDQAKICFTEARNMALKSAPLRKKATVLTHNIHVLSTASKMEALSSDYNTLDGPNPHCVILDEIHAYKTSGLYDIFISAVGARDQPLILMITTAGFNQEWFCFQQRKYGLQVLEGTLNDDELMVMIFTLDEEDEWTDERLWVKANPNLGESPSWTYLRGRIHTAKQKPAEQYNVKTKNLNLWVDAPKVWIDSDKWNECTGDVDEIELEGQTCYAGLDLATKGDFNAWIKLFPLEDGCFKLLCTFWIPEDSVQKHVDNGLKQLPEWIDSGLVKATPGNYVDYKAILEDILADFERFDIVSAAKDPWNSAWMYQELNEKLQPGYRDGKPVDRISDFAQTIKNMTSPTVYLEDLVDEKKLIHDGNPVMAWMMRNVVLEYLGKEVEDLISGKPQQARKPSKMKSSKKIDGPVAAVMALGEYLTWNWQGDNDGESQYENQTLFSF
ncbi:terminase large subunit [Spirosoma sp. BT702]|uniref:Terminase large subunit n=1 Tax=Spirosoma profusum TaxID=2771354 RepID=A0A927AW83_9BACT|nr:terminase large subunit [Spirosoma profusum]MBD2705598.1 terminase large subunit [Spirosoma profusum]